MAEMTKPQHARRWSGKKLVVVVCVAVVVTGAGAVTTIRAVNGASTTTIAGNAAPSGAAAIAEKLSLVVDPSDGTTDVALDTVVSVKAADGVLNSVSLTSPSGAVVTGSLDPSKQSWRSTGKLAPKTSNTVTADAVGPGGDRSVHVSRFDSRPPTATLAATIFPNSGLTVGIGQPIVIRFNHPVHNKTALLAVLHVSESTPVTGGWYWFSDRELHFRPELYWPTGERVTLNANLVNFDAGDGIYGNTDTSVQFTVGDAHISTANVATYTMTVTSNGVTVATYPMSAGRTKYPTMNGTHIDLGRQQDVRMVSSSVGIPVNSPDGYDEHVFWNVLITDGGEYVHAAPWSTGAQGNSNVSHGCINLSPANAAAFYNFSRVGDIIEVVGSPRPASTGDHGTMDWTVPFQKFIPLHD
jgi:lipoprotein-anchoring transpeptidase ErfK/SrfK